MLEENVVVAPLFDKQHRYWNPEYLLNAIFIEADIQKILKLPSSLMSYVDKLIWRGTANGNFLV